MGSRINTGRTSSARPASCNGTSWETVCKVPIRSILLARLAVVPSHVVAQNGRPFANESADWSGDNSLLEIMHEVINITILQQRVDYYK